MKETAYLLQAALVALWWVGLALSQRFFDAFQFPGMDAKAFWAFFHSRHHCHRRPVAGSRLQPFAHFGMDYFGRFCVRIALLHQRFHPHFGWMAAVPVDGVWAGLQRLALLQPLCLS